MLQRGTFITALSLLLLLASVGSHASEVSEDDDWSSPPPRSEVLTFLNTPVELLHAIYTNHTPKPTFVLYTDKHLYNNHLMEARRGVEQMAAMLPPNYADFYEMQMDETDLADRSWYAIVSMGIPRLPSLALYGCSLQRSFHFPGNFLNSFPAFFPHYFNGELTNVTGMVNWALSVAPTQYVDPVTLHQVDAVSIVSSHDDVRSWILNTAEGLDNKLSPSISVYPQRVLMAYVNLSSTLSGSEVVIASLFNRAAQKGNALLTAITDNAEVAAVWGIRKMNHAAHAPFSSVLEQWRSAGKKKHITAIASVRDLVVVKDELTPQNVASTVDDIVASTTTQDFRAVQKATMARVQRNVDLFRKHPMRKIASSHHLQRVMLTLQQSVKVVFFLRQSDEDFAKQFAVAEDFAKRIQSTAVNFKMNDYSIQEHMWAPPMRTEAFWIDADQQPAFTSHMELRSVPAVILLMPLPNAKEKEQIDNGVLYLNISHGAHIITRQDLNTPQEEPSSGLHDLKAFQPGFPRDSSELIRLFASPMLPKRLQYGMFPVHHYELVLEPEDEDNVNEELCLASKSSAAFCFLEVDLRHYPREVSPPPRLVRDLFDGDAMPDTDEEERDNGVKAKTSTPYSRRALEKKQEKEAQRLKWQEEMEEKRRRREERARLKRKTNTRRSSSTQPATRSFVPADVDGEREEEVAASTNNFKKSPATTPKQQLRSMPRMEEEEDDYTSYRSRMGDTSHFYVRRPKKPANFQPKRRFPQDVAFRNEAHYMSGVFVRRSTRETSPDVDNATDAPPERRKPEDDVILMVTSLEDE